MKNKDIQKYRQKGYHGVMKFRISRRKLRQIEKKELNIPQDVKFK